MEILVNEIEILVKNRNFCLKLKFLSKIEILITNWNIGKNRNF